MLINCLKITKVKPLLIFHYGNKSNRQKMVGSLSTINKLDDENVSGRLNNFPDDKNFFLAK